MNELFRKLPEPKDKVSLSKESLNDFHKTLTVYKNKWNLKELKFEQSNLIFVENLPPELYLPSGHFIASSIHNFILHSRGYYQTFVFLIGSRTFDIHLYLPVKDKKPPIQQVENYFDNCAEKMYLWLSLISPNISSHCSVKSSIHLYLTQFEKTFGKNGQMITPENVNSAFTTSCQEVTNIHIYRHEEWFKVFIHETFHCFGLDFSSMDNTSIEDEITKSFKVDNPNGIRVYESYCELWAQIMNVVIFSFMKSKNKTNFQNIFTHLINKELSFSFFQLLKVLQKFKVSYNDLIDAKCKTIKIKEDSHVLSYFVLKTILFSNLSSFEKWCKKNNNKMFRFEHENAMKYVELIVKHSKSSKMNDNLKKMSVFCKKINMTDKIKNTAKMTIIN